ncbi:MAG: hypothetical protein M0Z37_06265 [Nitrospiraceae bacterium]|jgi:hypothetical protein|nr:hypothetical protein [Nitrospiraceae bacterium]
MEATDDLDDALWALVRVLDPEDTGEVSGEPWMSPAFDGIVDRLLRALSQGSGPDPDPATLFARAALLDRTRELVSGIVSSRGALVDRLNALSRQMKAPYAQKLPIPPRPASALSKRI